MMMGFRNTFIVLGGLITLSAAPAWAGVGVELLGVGSYSMGSGTPAITGSMGYGGGAILDFKMGAKSEFQLGGLYETSNFNNGADVKNTLIHGMAGFKFFFSRAVAINFGGFYNSWTTNPLAFTTPDIGVYGGLALHIPLGTSVSFMINPQYCYALKSLTSGDGTSTITPHQFLGVAGFVFGMGK